MEHYRRYRLCQIGGGPPSKWEDEPAIELDWLIAVDDAVKKAEDNIRRRTNGG